MNIIRKLNHKRIMLGREIIFKILSFFEIRKMKKQKFELENYKTIGIVFICYQIGDSLIMTSILRPLRESGYKVVVFCNERANLVLKNSRYIDKIVISDNVKDFKNLREFKIDLLIDISYLTLNDTHRITLKRKIQPKYSIYLYLHINLNKKTPSIRELTTVHNEAINYQLYDKHVTYLYKTILNRLGIDTAGDLEYDFTLDDISIETAKEIIKKFGNKKIIIFNPYANVVHRSMSEEQIMGMLSFFTELKDSQTILIGEPQKISKLPKFDNVYCHMGSLYSAIALLSMSDLVVTVGTSIVHFSRCYNRKMIAIYTNLIYGKFIDNFYFGPFYENAIQLFSPTQEAKDFDINILKDKIREVLDIL